MHMDACETGAYWLLLIAHYQAGKNGLPDDDAILRRIAKVTPQKWLHIKKILVDRFVIEGGRWINLSVSDRLSDIQKKSEQNRANALKKNNSPSKSAQRSHSNPLTMNQIEDTNVSSTPLPPKGVILPDWINPDDWKDFSEMRKRIKKPMTNRAAMAIIKKLETFRNEGYSPEIILENSIRNSWQDVYAPKNDYQNKPEKKSHGLKMMEAAARAVKNSERTE